ncbi:hypothetical protein, partial [Kitasatospora sp. NPDC093806]|uniref:hypothetical protein n=1 Tax=Kitasatospora sp. NPDC093806 TaxID=3155075 RepID=UPI003449A83F
MITKPFLKPAVTFDATGTDVAAYYRGRSYALGLPGGTAVAAALSALDGRRDADAVAAVSGLDEAATGRLFAALAGTPLVLEGEGLVGPVGVRTGREAFWRLEAQLWNFRQAGRTAGLHVPRLFHEVGAGRAPVDVVKGFCLEICHQVSNAPTEISLAIAHAPTKEIRDLYMHFYEEEYSHGDILREALATWIPDAGIAAAVPLPSTAGMLANYNWSAESDPLMYAVALMRDEGSPLDAVNPPETDVYAAMKTHYEVPEKVVDRFEWHANLDTDNDHGFFPERVFAQVQVVDDARYARLTKAAR